ncbi:MAG TPA: glycosyl hydrolase family 79 C-terminal domain-containing protein [Edaphobacter sp.]|nr:glycosyl hydrolase family 79 C-terminal domain-containing protein [Edaphobacter sp.]
MSICSAQERTCTGNEVKNYPRNLAMAASLVLSALLAGCGYTPVGGDTRPGALVAADGTRSVVPVAADFLGLSMEWCNAQTVLGQASAGGADAIFAQYVANLRAYGAGPMSIRIGGNSTDTGGSCSTPTGIQSAQAMNEFARATDAKFSFGVNMASHDLSASKAQAAAYCAGMPSGSIAGFEIGNEPDLYTTPGWTADTYSAELSEYLAGVLSAQSCASSLMGPSFASFNGRHGDFIPNIQDILVTNQDKGLGAVTQHYYGGTNTATSGFLLTTAADNGPQRVLPELQAAHALGMAYRIDEMNSAWGGGAAGVSNAFESALWFIENAAELASEGVDGINIHGGMLAGKGYNYYTPFFITADGGGSFSLNNRGSAPATAPLYYGMLFFARAINGAHSTISPASISTSANIDAWSTVDGAGTERLILVNRDIANGAQVVVPQSASTASVCYLAAPSYSSTSGLKILSNFAGTTYQTFDTSTDGSPRGTVGWDVLTPNDGSFTIPIGATQAAIVTFGLSTGC